MTALSDLVYGKGNKPWPYFIDKYPVKVKQITGLDNDQLEKDIREAGDYLGGRTAAKCLMTRWDMHTVYNSFVLVANEAIKIANDCPLANSPSGAILEIFWPSTRTPWFSSKFPIPSKTSPPE